VTADATSLNQPLSSSDTTSQEAGDFVEDEDSPSVVEEAVRALELSQLREAVGRLPERHRHVLVRRHGLDGYETATLAELADGLGFSRERVRQIQRQAERMLARMLADGLAGEGTAA
jgi:RNA polymerase primary sigma factor